MRVLVTTTGSAGHFGPVVPFVDALLAAGDEVLVATRESSASTERFLSVTAAPLRDLRDELGLASHGTGSAARFTLAPPLLEDPAAPGPKDTRRFREQDRPAPPALPDWWDGAGDPLVYVTFGSVAPQMDFFPGLYRAEFGAGVAADVRSLPTADTAVDILRDLVAAQGA
jgi:UDP:flavonoid glycosyltransferase YjiC (YdhE family)